MLTRLRVGATGHQPRAGQRARRSRSSSAPTCKSARDDPEFYKRGTVVDVGYGAGQDGLFTSTYAQPVSRIRWEITEDTLIARLAYERIDGTDGKGTR